MVREIIIFKTRGLAYIHLFLKVSVEECTLDIHLVQLDLHVGGESHQNTDGLDPCNRCKCFLIIDPLFFVVTLNHQPSFVLSDCSKLTQLFLNTHLVPIIDLSSGQGSRRQTLFLSN